MLNKVWGSSPSGVIITGTTQLYAAGISGFISSIIVRANANQLTLKVYTGTGAAVKILPDIIVPVTTNLYLILAPEVIPFTNGLYVEITGAAGEVRVGIV